MNSRLVCVGPTEGMSPSSGSASGLQLGLHGTSTYTKKLRALL